MPHPDEFAEFETDEAAFDAMMAAAAPAAITDAPSHRTVTVTQAGQTRFTVTMPASALLTVATSATRTQGTSRGHDVRRRPAHHRPPTSSEVVAS
jgi:hypothetical protein